ncbi:hypothetical protein PQR67_24530 [Paraburkholderia fungorum]|uniref:hypothetical protein n=1 Tax=Paraburkholderia fungorum TaxID=134537 RepID=UPI0038BAB517
MDIAELGARTTSTEPALYVPEKLNRCERQISRGRRARLSAFQAANKKPLRRKSERSGFFVAAQRAVP